MPPDRLKTSINTALLWIIISPIMDWNSSLACLPEFGRQGAGYIVKCVTAFTDE